MIVRRMMLMNTDDGHSHNAGDGSSGSAGAGA